MSGSCSAPAERERIVADVHEEQSGIPKVLSEALGAEVEMAVLPSVAAVVAAGPDGWLTVPGIGPVTGRARSRRRSAGPNPARKRFTKLTRTGAHAYRFS